MSNILHFCILLRVNHDNKLNLAVNFFKISKKSGKKLPFCLHHGSEGGTVKGVVKALHFNSKTEKGELWPSL